jgi:hypothetical protein
VAPNGRRRRNLHPAIKAPHPDGRMTPKTTENNPQYFQAGGHRSAPELAAQTVGLLQRRHPVKLVKSVADLFPL